MKKYVCTVCGFVYDEAAGLPDSGIEPGTKWENLPGDWVCPLCGAGKDEFEAEQEEQALKAAADVQEKSSGGLSFAAMSALCSNLSKGCEKQMELRQQELFAELSDYFKEKAGVNTEAGFDGISERIDSDLAAYAGAKNTAQKSGDRGALRALVWGEKVAKIQGSVLKRYKKTGSGLLEGTDIHVCEICGFVYIGDEAPDICPVCKVPKFKITKIGR